MSFTITLDLAAIGLLAAIITGCWKFRRPAQPPRGPTIPDKRARSRR